MLLRAGWTEEQVELFVGAVCEVARDEESKGRIRSVISTAKRLAQGRPATGTPTLAQIDLPSYRITGTRHPLLGCRVKVSVTMPKPGWHNASHSTTSDLVTTPQSLILPIEF